MTDTMTDTEHAAVLRDVRASCQVTDCEVCAAIERAIELLERDAWRACADQLAACFEQWMLQAAPVREALAEYERLKAGES